MCHFLLAMSIQFFENILIGFLIGYSGHFDRICLQAPSGYSPVVVYKQELSCLLPNANEIISIDPPRNQRLIVFVNLINGMNFEWNHFLRYLIHRIAREISVQHDNESSSRLWKVVKIKSNRDNDRFRVRTNVNRNMSKQSKFIFALRWFHVARINWVVPFRISGSSTVSN